MTLTLLLLGVVVGASIHWLYFQHQKREALKIASEIVGKARYEAQKNIQKLDDHVTEEIHSLQKNYEFYVQETKASFKDKEKNQRFLNRHIEEKKSKLSILEEKLQKQQEVLDYLEQQRKRVGGKYKTVSLQHEKKLLVLCKKERKELEEKFIDNLNEKLEKEFQNHINNYTQKLEENSSRQALRILSSVIQRHQSLQHYETPGNTIELEDEATLESILGDEELKLFLRENLKIELEGDSSLNVLSIVQGDGCAREITRRLLESCLAEKSWNLEYLKEKLALYQEVLEEEMMESAQEASLMAKIPSLPRNIASVFGRLKYRTSYGQNILWHSVEVSHLASIIAAEIGLDTELAKKAGFFHDIGKAVDHDIKGDHIEIGVEILKDYETRPEVLQGVEGHHNDANTETPYAILVSVADAISASRPGARRGAFEKYVVRLEKLESIVGSLPGIKEAYAISAGREIRIIVDPLVLSDEETSQLAQKIVQNIEEKLSYPGTVMITIIREMKIVEYAR